MQRYEDARLERANLDEALEIGREYGDRLCAQSGGDPVGIDCVPLRNGAYRVVVSWTIQQPGGRRGRKRRQQQSAELVPPQRDRSERIAEELAK